MADRIISLNIGAGKLTVAEFSVKSGKTPVLLKYGFAGIIHDAENPITPDYGALVRSVMKEQGIRQAPLVVALSGAMVISRFVKLPAVGEDKLQQMVQYEVEQNIPFPLEEIVWTCQFIGDGSSGEQAAMIVAAKLENVREITNSLSNAGFDLLNVDVAPMALYNSFKYNYPECDGCSIILDIGSRATNLVFVEDEKIYSRCILVAGNAITQEIAKVFGTSFQEAEELKLERAFVSQGGTYQAENETDDRISKIARNVLTRLHAEINRSINFYRSQQGGSDPKRIYITGGSSAMPHLDLFLREKLGIEVEVLNPFNNIDIGPKIDAGQLESDGLVVSECTGLALRCTMQCPVEIDLTPPEILKSKDFKKRIPFLGLAALGLLACLTVWNFSEQKEADELNRVEAGISAKLTAVKKQVGELRNVQLSRDAVLEKADAAIEYMKMRSAWLARIRALRQSVSLFPGMWLTSIVPMMSDDGKTAVGVSVQGRIWNDCAEQIRKSRPEAGTVVEQLANSLKKQSAFGKGENDVRIVGSKEVGAYLSEFQINARFAAETAEDEAKDKEAK